jgi:hypothetical protein
MNPSSLRSSILLHLLQPRDPPADSGADTSLHANVGEHPLHAQPDDLSASSRAFMFLRRRHQTVHTLQRILNPLLVSAAILRWSDPHSRHRSGATPHTCDPHCAGYRERCPPVDGGVLCSKFKSGTSRGGRPHSLDGWRPAIGIMACQDGRTWDEFVTRGWVCTCMHGVARWLWRGRGGWASGGRKQGGAPEWHRRVNGILAGQLAAHRGKTARAWTKTGSCWWLPRPPRAPGSVTLLTCIDIRPGFTSIGFGNVRVMKAR